VINMAVAATMHLTAPDQCLRMAAHAIEDGIMFLGLIFIGPGRYALDEVLRRPRAKTQWSRAPRGEDLTGRECQSAWMMDDRT
jgi:hypothetical protein